MSRQNLVTPHAVLKLLTYAARQPWGAQYQDTFPVAGVDGSLADRFKDSPAQGRVLGKTGTLAHVNAMSGYATTASGEHVVYSVMGNNHGLTARRAQDVIDDIVNAIVKAAPAAKK
jgi:D-alanyl-D-alanine carboxypeptidase/D-alanyl-D-alanine-endopeptidase (penicillin-binding protein 4)